MIGAHTRLRLTDEQRACLDAYLSGFSVAVRTAYHRVACGTLSENQVYSFATQQGLTAHQAKSVVTHVQQYRSMDVAQCEWQMEQLKLRIDALQQYLTKIDKDIEQLSLAQQNAILHHTSPHKTPAFQKNLKRPRQSSSFVKPNSKKLARLKAIRFQKNRSLQAKQTQLLQLEQQYKTGQYSRTFGGKKLFMQRQQLDDPQSLWDLSSWKQEWNRKRQFKATLVGDGSHTAGNQSAQIVFDDHGKASLLLRLLDTQADAALNQAASEMGVLVDKVPNRMQYKRLVLPLTFTAKDQHNIQQAQELGLPITVQIIAQPTPKAKRKRRQFSRGPSRSSTKNQKTTSQKNSQQARPSKEHVKSKNDVLSQNAPKGQPSRALDDFTSNSSAQPLAELGYYVHVSFDLPAAPIIASRHQGCLGVDINAWGLSYAAVGPDGQLLCIDKNNVTTPKVSDIKRDGSEETSPEKTNKHKEHQQENHISKNTLKGDVELNCRTKTSEQSHHLICHAVNQLVNLAKEHRLAIAIEDLNFAKTKAKLREMPAGYARMLSRLNTAGFAKILAARCKKEGVSLHRVDPAWSSVAGFAKYGLSLNLSADQAGAFIIARGGVLGSLPNLHPMATHSQVTGKKLSPKFVRQLQQKRDNIVIRYTEPCGFAKPLPLERQRMLHGQGGSSWKTVRKVLGKRTDWSKAWIPLSAMLASVQEKGASPALSTTEGQRQTSATTRHRRHLGGETQDAFR